MLSPSAPAAREKPSSAGWRFGAFYFLSFAAVALHGIYGNLYFQRRGLSKLELGILSIIPAWLNAAAPLAWGFVSDSLRRRRLPMFAMHLGTALLYPAFWYWNGESFLTLCVLMGVFTFFFSGTIPLTDAWALSYLARRGGDYGRLRSWGSVGFIAPLIGSLFALRRSDVRTAAALLPVFVGFTAFRLISSAWSFGLPEPANETRRGKLDWRSLRVYAHPYALVFFFSMFVGRFIFGPYYTYFSIYLDELGVPDGAKGVYWIVAVGAETVIIAVSGRLLARFGEVPLLVAGLGAMSFRLLVFSFEPAWHVVLATQALHALTFGGTHVASVRVIHRLTPEPFRASGQTFLGALVGAGGVLGGVVGGVWAEAHGLASLYRLLGIVAAMATIAVAIGFRQWRSESC